MANSKRELDKYNKNTIVQDAFTIGMYKEFTYFNKTNNKVIKFRFKQSKSKDKLPLFVYFHGAGCIGYDNLKQKIEFDFSIGGIMPENAIFFCHKLIILPIKRHL